MVLAVHILIGFLAGLFFGAILAALALGRHEPPPAPEVFLPSGADPVLECWRPGVQRPERLSPLRRAEPGRVYRL